MVSHICLTDLQLNKVNPSDTEAPFLDLDLSITNGIVSTKIYDYVTTLILKLLIWQVVQEGMSLKIYLLVLVALLFSGAELFEKF